MTDQPIRSSQAFNMFSYVSFMVAAAMMAGGICFMEASFAAKGFYAMAALMLVSSTVGVTRALRDREEAERVCNRPEEVSGARA